MNKKKWYIVHTLSGSEDKVKANLDSRVKSENLSEKVDQIVIPTEQVSEIKRGKKKITERHFFPGYILIHMEMDDDTWFVIKSVPGVTGFIGPKRHPTPLSQKEVDNIMKRTREAREKPQPKVVLKKGEAVRVKEGPFFNFSGIIEEVMPDKGKLKVDVSIFGRFTPVELECWQVEKI